MAYIIKGEAATASTGALAQSAKDVYDALRRARRMRQIGLMNVTIEDGLGNKVGGDDLVACCEGRKSLTASLELGH